MPIKATPSIPYQIVQSSEALQQLKKESKNKQKKKSVKAIKEKQITMAFNKVVAVFLMCMFVLTAMHANKAEAHVTPDDFKKCYETCHQECFQNGKGNGFSFCEKKCDNDCSDKEIQAKLEDLMSSP